MEKELGCGQLEQLIIQAKDELGLIAKMKDWKPWDVPKGHKIEVIAEKDVAPEATAS